MGQLDGILQGMTDAETGERGYILTGDDSYLAPYLRGLSEVRETSAAVRKLTADNPHQQSSLNAVEPLIAERLRELQERIRVRRNAGLAAGAAAMREGAGKEYMDRVRATISAMKSEEERLLTLRSAELATSSRKTRTVLVLGELLAILSLGIAGFHHSCRNAAPPPSGRSSAQAECRSRAQSSGAERPNSPNAPKISSAPIWSCSNSPMLLPTTCRSRCEPSPASRNS